MIKKLVSFLLQPTSHNFFEERPCQKYTFIEHEESLTYSLMVLHDICDAFDIDVAEMFKLKRSDNIFELYQTISSSFSLHDDLELERLLINIQKRWAIDESCLDFRHVTVAELIEFYQQQGVA